MIKDLVKELGIANKKYQIAADKLQQIRNKMFSELNFLSYIMDHSVVFNPKENQDLFNKAKCLILCRESTSGKNMFAWAKEYDPEIRKKYMESISLNPNLKLKVFDNGIDDVWFIEKIGDISDIRKFTIESINETKIIVKYMMNQTSNVTGEQYSSWGGLFTFDIAHLESWLANNKNKQYKLKDAPKIPAGFL